MPEMQAHVVQEVLSLRAKLRRMGFGLRIEDRYFAVVKGENTKRMIYFNAKTIDELRAYMRGLSDSLRLTRVEHRKLKDWL